MKKIGALAFMISICLTLILSGYPFPEEQGSITTLFLVRHAEKDGTVWEDPGLTPAGTTRADELAYILKHVELDAIYSTPFARTKLTVQPTAEEKGLEVKLYKPNDKEFLNNVLDEHAIRAVLWKGFPEMLRISLDLFERLCLRLYNGLIILLEPKNLINPRTKSSQYLLELII